MDVIKAQSLDDAVAQRRLVLLVGAVLVRREKLRAVESLVQVMCTIQGFANSISSAIYHKSKTNILLHLIKLKQSASKNYSKVSMKPLLRMQ